MKSTHSIITSHRDNIHKEIFSEMNNRNLCYYVYYMLTDNTFTQRDVPLLITESLGEN